MTEIHLAYATDNGYLTPTAVSIASALAWTSYPLVIHVLDDGIDDERWGCFENRPRRCLRGSDELIRHKIDLTAFAGTPRWHGGHGAYARLLLPSVLPWADWCVYCDGDTLFTDDIAKLVPYFDDRCLIIGHDDCGNCEPQFSWFEQHGIVMTRCDYVCSGFLLMNLRLFRAMHASERCIDFMRNHLDLHFPDQDALAFVCRDRIGKLPPQWGGALAVILVWRQHLIVQD